MIWIRSNSWGLAMFVVGGLIAGVGSFILKIDDAPVLMSVGASLIVMDAISRVRFRNQPGWLLRRQYGGYLFYVPMWLIGSVVFAANLLKALQV
jgi:hypothetical protein